ncbi:hypothetical protein Mapa_000487 [Marchantia paleacea]|nr:hypothetical protein Mapa_000487 [Marchantia paleacea]
MVVINGYTALREKVFCLWLLELMLLVSLLHSTFTLTRVAQAQETVTVRNSLETDDMIITCFSKDDQISKDRPLHPSEKMSWDFHRPFLWWALFACHTVYKNQHICWDAYDEHHKETYCDESFNGIVSDYHCMWDLESDGVYYYIKGEVKFYGHWAGPC